MTEPDLLAALVRSLEAAARKRDNLPCPTCGGDRLRPNFTGSGKCHAPTRQETDR